MIGRTRGVVLAGLHGEVIDIEADIAAGLPAFLIGGLPDAACRQAGDRVKAAAANIGQSVAAKRVTVNLSPAWLPKPGSGFDLGIAVSVLTAAGAVPFGSADDIVHIGELGLDGGVRPVRGVLPLVIAAVRAGYEKIVVPADNAAEAALVAGAQIIAAQSLQQVLDRHTAVAGGGEVHDLSVAVPVAPAAEPDLILADLAHVVGQSEARLALEIAAAGGHHLVMVGPPGAGKTMLAECLPSLLPTLDDDAALEVTAVHSVLGVLEGGALVRRPPFVAPHHGASSTAVIGGGSGQVRPGLISRAHRGVLFLDEAPEFKASVLQTLRQPLESGTVTVARARGSVVFPARFQLALAANPCPCGRAYGKGKDCSCSPRAKREYIGKLEGPLLDRVDLQLFVNAPSRASLSGPPGESSVVVAARVAEARRVQADWLRGTGWKLASEVPGPKLREHGMRLPAAITRDLDTSLDRGLLTVRGYDRVLRLAWTLASLRGGGSPGRDEVGDALTMRTGSGLAA